MLSKSSLVLLLAVLVEEVPLLSGLLFIVTSLVGFTPELDSCPPVEEFCCVLLELS